MQPQPGQCCWIDLAANDANSAAAFYAELFGWQPVAAEIAGGELLRLEHHGRAFGSIYQLGQQQREAGAPSHWTPYIAVESLDHTTGRAESLGGRVLVRCFEAPGQARVGLVMDPVGALFGIWQPVTGSKRESNNL